MKPDWITITKANTQMHWDISEKPLSKDMQLANAIWAICMKMAMASRKIMPKPSNGTEKQLSKDMQLANAIWASCIDTAMASRKTMTKP